MAKTINVSTLTELTAALKSATGGETVFLKAGTDFGNLSLYKPTANYSSPVIITTDPENPAHFNSVSLQYAKNLTFDGVDVDVDVNSGRSIGVAISQSENIIFKNADISANLTYDASEKLVSGVSVRGSQNIIVSDNDIHNVSTGLGVRDSSFVTVNNNEFSHNILDNMNVASNVTDLVIQSNQFYAQDTIVPGQEAHHFDNLQFWVLPTEATKDTARISIVDNHFFKPEDVAGSATNTANPQAIFLRESYEGNVYTFKDVTISGNIIENSTVHGISVSKADGITVTNNTIIYAGDPVAQTQGYVPSINIGASSTGVDISNNIMPSVGGYPKTDTATFHDNITYNIGNGELASLLVNPYAENPTATDFATLNTQDLQGKGAATQEVALDKPTAEFTQHYTLNNDQYVYTFDAGTSLAKAGGNLDGASYEWHFADGTVLKGLNVEKIFDKAGPQDVTLIVTDKNGLVDILTREDLPIRDIVAVTYDFDVNLTDESDSPSVFKGISNPIYVDSELGGKALLLGGTDHLTFNMVKDADLSDLRELTLAVTVDIAKADNTSSIALFNNHGLWGVTLNPGTNQVQIGVAGTFLRFTPTENLVSGTPHDIAMTVDQNTLIFYVDGKAAYQTALSAAQAETLLKEGTYGITVGGSPWGNAYKGSIDNLYIGATALDAEDIKELHNENFNIQTHPALTLTGTSTNDTLTGGEGNDTLSGFQQADKLYGNGGNDYIVGGHSNDVLFGGAGSDIFAYRDISEAIGKGVWSEKITDFVSGVDKLDFSKLGYTGIAEAGKATLGQLEFSVVNGVGILKDSFSNFELRLEGLTTLKNSDVIWRSDNATVTNGDDTITITERFGQASVGSNVLDTGVGNDIVNISNYVVDVIGGGEGHDKISTGAGNDYLYGGNGNDTLNGGGHNDVIVGGNGDDVLIGGGDNDTLTGGSGSDIFVFTRERGSDIISDFDSDSAGGQDFIDIRLLNITAADFDKHVSVSQVNADTHVLISGQLAFVLNNVPNTGNSAITSSDFLF